MLAEAEHGGLVGGVNVEAEDRVDQVMARLEDHVEADRIALLDVLHPLAGRILEPDVDQPDVDIGHVARGIT